MKIFVKNLAEKVTSKELRKEAEKFGKVESAAVVIDPKTEKSMGIAYIETASKEDGSAIVKGLKGLELKGKKITVKESTPEKSQPAAQTKQGKAWQGSNFTGTKKGFAGGKSNIRIGGANRGR